MRASATNKKRAGTWSQEFRQFRHTYYYSQRELAELLGICKRSVCSIETEFVTNPSHKTQRNLRQLRYQHEQKRLLEEAKRQVRLRAIRGKRPGPVPTSHLFRRESMPVKLEA